MSVEYQDDMVSLLMRNAPFALDLARQDRGLSFKPVWAREPMTEGKVLAIVLVCYGVLLLATVWQAML